MCKTLSKNENKSIFSVSTISGLNTLENKGPGCLLLVVFCDNMFTHVLIMGKCFRSSDV